MAHAEPTAIRPGRAALRPGNLRAGAWAVAAVAAFPGMLTETVTTTSSNAEALEAMERANLDAVVVVDAAGRVPGVVERDRILARMVLALSGAGGV